MTLVRSCFLLCVPDGSNSPCSSCPSSCAVRSASIHVYWKIVSLSPTFQALFICLQTKWLMQLFSSESTQKSVLSFVFSLKAMEEPHSFPSSQRAEERECFCLSVFHLYVGEGAGAALYGCMPEGSLMPGEGAVGSLK